MMMANIKRSYNNYFIDPETLIEKSEIINNKKIINEEENANKNNLQQIKYDNDAIIEIDTDTTDTENSNNSYQSEFEKVINKSEVTLEVLKEVPHDDKENIISSTFNEFGKRGRGRPKEDKPKKRKTTENVNSSEASTAPKTFNISLGFLGSKSKISRDKSKTKLKNSIKSEPDDINDDSVNNDINESTKKIVKKRGRSKQKQYQPNNKSITKNADTNETVQLTSLTDCRDEINDNNSDNGSSIPVNNCIDSQENSITTSSTQINGENDNFLLPVKKKRGRPFGTFKVKDASRDLKKKKITGQKGRPLLSDRIIEIKPKGRRGRPNIINKPSISDNNIKHNKPGRPSLGLKKLKKYDKPGRPPGPPKPIKIPGRRGRKRNPDSPPKKPKIPGRGRGRPSFASLKEIKPEIENKSELKIEQKEQEQQQNDSSSNSWETDSESENNLTISSQKTNKDDDENNIKNVDFVKNDIKNIDIIETISLASSSDTIKDEFDNSNSYDDNSANSGNGYFTVTDNKISKVGVQLEYMFREEKAILQKQYI